MRFLRCSRNPLRGSAWSRCKNSRFFAISAVLARPSAGIGVVEVKKLEVFCNFCGARATLCGDRRGRGAKGFLRLLLFELVLGSCLVVRAPAPGTGGSRVRFLPGPRAGVARCNLHFKANCAEQLAQSKLHRATCADQLAPTSLRRAPCLEQLAQSNLRRATYAEQLAQSNLHRAPCLVLSRACFTNASCREKERILQRWADLACDVLLSGEPWSSFCFKLFLVFFPFFLSFLLSFFFLFLMMFLCSLSFFLYFFIIYCFLYLFLFFMYFFISLSLSLYFFFFEFFLSFFLFLSVFLSFFRAQIWRMPRNLDLRLPKCCACHAKKTSEKPPKQSARPCQWATFRPVARPWRTCGEPARRTEVPFAILRADFTFECVRQSTLASRANVAIN